MPPRGLKMRNRGCFNMYIFIYRLKYEDFKYDHYIETDECGPLWGAFTSLYATIKDEDKILSSNLFLKAIKSMSTAEEMLEFFTSITKETIKIVDLFSGANRVDIGQALSPA